MEKTSKQGSKEINQERETKGPIKKFRAGAISATIWENSVDTKDNKEMLFNTISIERNYKDKQDNWKSTNSLRVSDLPKARLVLEKAYEFLLMERGDKAQA